MLLGIVLHASLPYCSRLAGIEHVWPADDDQSLLLLLVFDFIHIWRMPVFFLLAGFFAHLVLERRPESAFAADRLRRIALPRGFAGSPTPRTGSTSSTSPSWRSRRSPSPTSTGGAGSSS